MTQQLNLKLAEAIPDCTAAEEAEGRYQRAVDEINTKLKTLNASKSEANKELTRLRSVTCETTFFYDNVLNGLTANIQELEKEIVVVSTPLGGDVLDPVHMKYGLEKVLTQSKESTKTICQRKHELEAQIVTYNTIVFDGGLDAVMGQFDKVVYD